MNSSGYEPSNFRPDASHDHVVYEFDGYRLDPTRRQLRHTNGATLNIPAKAFDALTYLVTHPGRLLIREELTDFLWPHTIVEENNLNQTIWVLRRALGDDAHDKRFIATVPGRGYQFVANVHTVILDTPPVAAPEGVLSAETRDATVVTPDATVSPAIEAGVTRRRVKIRRTAILTVQVCLVITVGLVAVGLRKVQPPIPPSVGGVAHIVPVTTLPGDEQAAALSPDGAFVAFTWDHGDGYTGIYVKPVTGSETPVSLTTERHRYRDPTWSPDGRRIAFLRQRGPADFEILVAPVLADGHAQTVGSASMQLTSREGWPRLCWSPDGEYLLFSTDAGPEAEATASTLIHAIALRTGDITMVTRGERAFDTSPAISPDGAQIAFTRFDVSQRLPVLMVQPLNLNMTAVGEPLPVPGVPPGLAHSPSWSPDGRSLFLVVGQQVFEWVAGTIARPVYTFGASVRSLSIAWKQDRPIAVASTSDTDGDIWVLPIDPATHAALAPAVPRLRSTELEQHPRFSPDGSQLAFVSRRNGGRFAVWLASADGRNPRQITNIVAHVTGYPNWSPDGSRIAFHASFPSQPRQTFIVDLAANTTRPIGEGATPSWSPDGEYVYVGEVGWPSTAATTVTRIHVNDGTRERLFVGDLPTVTRDGTHLLYAQIGKFGIWRRSLDGDIASNVEEKLVDDYIPTLGGIVPLDDGFIYPSHTPEGVPHAFRYYDYSSGETRDIGPAPASLALGLTVSADGRELLYAAGAISSGANLVLLQFE